MRWLQLVLASLFFSCPLFSEELQKIVLVSSESLLLWQESGGEQEISFVGISHREGLRERLKPFLGKQIEPELLSSIKEEILSFYREADPPIASVEIPEQEVRNGLVAFALKEATISKVEYSGNRYFPDRLFQKYLSVKEGDPLVKEALFNNIAWLNRNPFHYTQIILSPGAREGTSDLQCITKDRFPVSPYVGVDNTGTSIIGRTRLFAGFNWGNAFWINDLLSYQFTSCDTPHRFFSHFASYTSFLPWKHTALFYGGYAEIHPPLADFHSAGKDIQASFRYLVPFYPLYTPYRREWSVGFDYKYINTNLFFIASTSNLPVLVHTAVIMQGYLGYQMEKRTPRHNLVFKMELFPSLAAWLPHQEGSNYQQLRPHAQVKYCYGRLAFGDTIDLSRGFSLSALLRGQVATGPLLSSEQFGLGGHDTVRGYEERIFLADNAICGNAEIRFPKSVSTKRGELQFLAFADMGFGKNDNPGSGVEAKRWLWSIGPGVRWNLVPRIAGRFDFGFPKAGRKGRGHFSLSLRF